MKIKVLSLLVPALLVVGAANIVEVYNKDGNELDLYGKVDGLHYLSDNKDVDDDQTYMRLGFKGEAQVTDQLTGYSQWEYQTQGDSAENENSSWTRMTFAGPKSQDVGSFGYGHNRGVAYDVTSWIDVLPKFGGGTYGFDNFVRQRSNGFATYRNTDFSGLVSGLSFVAQYQNKSDSVSGEGITGNGRGVLCQNGDGTDGSITYDCEGFGIGGAISGSKHTDNQNSPLCISNGDRAETYTGGLKYDANNIYLTTQYTQTYDATRVSSLSWVSKAQNFEAITQYQFDFGLRPSVAYLQSKGKGLGVINDHNYDDEDILKYVGAGTTYYSDENISAYVDYKISLLDDNQFTHDAGINTDNIVALGLVYQL